VTIEAKFVVGEYQIVILSAKGLATWLALQDPSRRATRSTRRHPQGQKDWMWVWHGQRFQGVARGTIGRRAGAA
jgi:hypothetical protein